jgi:hypothetical protein
MEQKLRRLFDFQRFEENPRLKAMLEAAQKRTGQSGWEEGELSDDEAELLSAAGTQVADPNKEKRS